MASGFVMGAKVEHQIRRNIIVRVPVSGGFSTCICKGVMLPTLIAVVEHWAPIVLSSRPIHMIVTR